MPKIVSCLASNFIKKRLQHRCFPVNIAKFLRTASFKEDRWLLLTISLCITLVFRSLTLNVPAWLYKLYKEFFEASCKPPKQEFISNNFLFPFHTVIVAFTVVSLMNNLFASNLIVEGYGWCLFESILVAGYYSRCCFCFQFFFNIVKNQKFTLVSSAFIL